MRQMLFFLTAVLPVMLLSCSDDSNTDTDNLNGQVWESKEEGSVITEITQLTFTASTFTAVNTTLYDINGNGEFEEDEITKEALTGTYSYKHPDITLIPDDNTENTIKGLIFENSMKLDEITEEGKTFTTIFEKK